MDNVSKQTKGIAFALVTACISGVSIFLNKFALGNTNPYLFTGLKNAVAAILLLMVLLGVNKAGRLRELKSRQWLVLAVIGIVGGGLPFMLFFKGLSLTSAAQGAFIHKSMFLLSVPLATLFLKEKTDKTFTKAAIFLLMGNLLLLQKLPFSFSLGDGLILAATLLWTIEHTISKKVLKILPAEIVGFGRMFFGSLVIWIFIGISGEAVLLPSFSLKQGLGIAIASLFLFGYVTCWYQALKMTKLTTALAILLLGGPITSLLTLLFAPGFFNANDLLSALFTILGLIVLVGIKNILPFLNKTCLLHKTAR